MTDLVAYRFQRLEGKRLEEYYAQAGFALAHLVLRGIKNKSIDNKTPKEYTSAWMKSFVRPSLLRRREGRAIIRSRILKQPVVLFSRGTSPAEF